MILDSLSALALIVASLAVVWRFIDHYPGFVLGALLGTPLFFEVTSTGLDLGPSVFDSRAGAVVLPVSVFAAPLFVAIAWKGARNVLEELKLGDTLVLALVGLCVWAVLVFVWGLLERGASIPVFLQVVAPLWFVLVGFGLKPRFELRSFSIAFVGATSATTALMLVSSAVLPSRLGITDDRLIDELIIGLVIYQAWDYVPLLLACAAVIAFACANRTPIGWVFGAAAIVLSTGVILLYSRGAIATLLIGMACITIFAVRGLSRLLQVTAAVIGSACVVVGLLGASSAGVASAQRVLDTFDFRTGAVETSNATRAEATRLALDQIVANPIVGRAMTPSETDPVTQQDRTVNTHNQYLDYAVRGGVPLALLFVVVALVVVGSLVRETSTKPGDGLLRGVAAAMIAVLFVSNLLQVNFVQPLTAFPLWMIVGVTGSMRRTRHLSSGRRLYETDSRLGREDLAHSDS